MGHSRGLTGHVSEGQQQWLLRWQESHLQPSLAFFLASTSSRAGGEGGGRPAAVSRCSQPSRSRSCSQAAVAETLACPHFPAFMRLGSFGRPKPPARPAGSAERIQERPYTELLSAWWWQRVENGCSFLPAHPARPRLHLGFATRALFMVSPLCATTAPKTGPRRAIRGPDVSEAYRPPQRGPTGRFRGRGESVKASQWASRPREIREMGRRYARVGPPVFTGAGATHRHGTHRLCRWPPAATGTRA